MRNTKRGSWFIQELNTALRHQARDTHLSDILVQVNICLLCFYIWETNSTVILTSFFLLPRSTDASRRGKVTPRVRPTIAAKRCQSSPAHCAKTSTFSPSTSPSIDMQICTFRLTHTDHSLHWSISERATQLLILHRLLPHIHTFPLLQLHIQTGFIRSDHRRARVQTLGKEKGASLC